LRALHAATGIVPLAAYLIWHLFTYAHALSGEAALVRTLSRGSRWPWLPALIVLAALGFHAAYGITLAIEHWQAGRTKTLQRATGIVLFAFVAYHFFDLEVPVLLGRMSLDEIYPMLVFRFSSTAASIPAYAGAYLLALLAAAMHIGIGLFELCVSSGTAVSQRSKKVAAGLLAAAGLALFLVGADIVVYFATGERAIIPRVLVPGQAQGAAACGLLPAAPPARK
jgi:succinate dehydrogenase/fumarate reductase cytochrome b subunit (b558 family)